MQFSIITILSLVAVAFAAPISIPSRVDDLTSRQDITARQAPAPPTEASAMSDANGNVVAFDSTGVYQAATAAGQ
ncbi:hypothetical protein M430DRAFT_45808 [Amorphotheca resinae ATCC 22711]|uniref:Uncharacterized protein n=1 Tax=Amorphotheca resinae ATCC 22711 TaxID=857342 RepID=A0A2T3APQ2_AMORE|nr:hypothetical protein M430DRAFT_45808 [Amorphotheca resinae ATCC 22711]PSS06972.1 hypothetical protein M430DRAFT_45808 [Amorphotheca resinae ATCC 22711]